MRKLGYFLLIAGVSFSLYANTLFEYEDTKGDDNGPGTYTYPYEDVFFKGCFDILKFRLYEDTKDYNFEFTIAIDFKNHPRWKNPNGWDVQIFDVYLKFKNGKNKYGVAGRNVKMEEGWDKVIVVSPEKNEKMWKNEIEPKNTMIYDDDPKMSEENLVADIILPSSYIINKNVLTVKVPKDKLKDMRTLQGVQVILGGSEGYPNKIDSYIRAVNQEASKWRIGGGSDYNGDPNIMDILGDNSKLKDYVSTEDKTVYPYINLIPVNKK